jgi:hypothetical protein
MVAAMAVPVKSQSENPSATAQSKLVHSPGPWKAEKCFGGDGFDYVIFSGGSMIASTMGTEYINEETDIANANLMAAAPDLLKSLKDLVEQFHAYENGWLGEGVWRVRIGLPMELKGNVFEELERR